MFGRSRIAPTERRIVIRRVEVDARRADSGLRTAGLAALAVLGCAEKYSPPTAPDVPIRAIDAGMPDVPVSAVDVGIADVGVDTQIMDLTGAPPGSIFYLGTHAEALRLNQIAQITFQLPTELKELFGKVSFWGILGPRIDSEGRSPFELIDFVIDPNTGVVKAGVKPLPGAFSEGEANLWHLVAEVGEGEDINYCVYGLSVAEEVRETPDAGTRRDAGRRREDAGTRTPDVPSPIHDITRGEGRPRM